MSAKRAARSSADSLEDLLSPLKHTGGGGGPGGGGGAGGPLICGAPTKTGAEPQKNNTK